MRTTKKSGNMKKLIKGLNEMADEELVHGILKENKKFNKEDLKVKTLTERQSDVMANIEKDLGINLSENKKKGGTVTMSKEQGAVKEITKTTKQKVAPNVDVREVETQAERYLKELEDSAHMDPGRYEIEETRVGYLTLKSNSRFIAGIRYEICKGVATYAFVAREPYKNYSDKLKGAYAPNNWTVLFPIDGLGVKKFSLIIGESAEKYQFKAKPVVAPKAKPTKPAVKKVKPVKKHI